MLTAIIVGDTRRRLVRAYVAFALTYLLFVSGFQSLSALSVSAAGISRRTVAPMSVAKDDFGVAIVRDQIYAIGGMTGPTATPLGDNEVYDPKQNAWGFLPPLPTPRRAVRAAAVGDTIYVMGGSREDNTTVADVDAFNTITRTWSQVAPLPTPLESMGLVTVGNAIYAVGGLTESGSFANFVYVFDPGANTWFHRTPMPTPRSDFSAVFLDGFIYAIGGVGPNGPLASVERYDVAADTWRAILPLPEPMVNLGAAAVGNQIHALLHFSHYTYSPGTDQWNKSMPMFLPRHGFGIAALHNDLYIIGGCHMDLFDTRDTELFVFAGSPRGALTMRGLAIVLGALLVSVLVIAIAYVVRQIRPDIG